MCLQLPRERLTGFSICLRHFEVFYFYLELGARRLTRFLSLPSGPTSFGRGVHKGEKWERLAWLDLEIFAIKLSGDPSSPSVRSLARGKFSSPYLSLIHHRSLLFPVLLSPTGILSFNASDAISSCKSVLCILPSLSYRVQSNGVSCLSNKA